MSPTKLYASGHNAWKQTMPDVQKQPNDIYSFSQIKGRLFDDIRDIQAFLSHTIFHVAPAGTTWTRPLPQGSMPRALRKLYGPEYNESYVLLTLAGNGKIAAKGHDGNLRMYESARRMLTDVNDCVTYPGVENIKQIVGYEVGFAALDSYGNVFTWGDERFPACLGRPVTADSPADFPHKVPNLGPQASRRVGKIAGNGYMLAAVTLSNCLYCWGGHPGKAPILRGLGTAPHRQNARGKKVLDVGVGDSHLIVLTDDDKIMVIGDNTHGQLGIAADKATEWTEVALELHGAVETIVCVKAGPTNSFIVVASMDPGDDLDYSVDDEDEESDEDDAPFFVGRKRGRESSNDDNAEQDGYSLDIY
ncbi:regulator of chromosome condensation 1/beta-lactamase-inhibitor protein II [Coniochaeta sp. 2T2.1]|nr:regulator of chromosome condensation 1/beta-lactamase-inhibitor protein II [Coniochaeta sp. 2T2.1]